MKKLTCVVMAGLMVLLGVTGCDLNKNQIKAACTAAGSGAALGWVAYDNPTDEQKTQVSEVLTVVQASIAGVGTNSYVAVIYPLVQQYVNSNPKIKPSDKVAILTGCLAVLSGIDIMFASYPEWKADVDNVGSYVDAFIGGANSILLMPCTDGACAPAVKHYKMRTVLRGK